MNKSIKNSQEKISELVGLSLTNIYRKFIESNINKDEELSSDGSVILEISNSKLFEFEACTENFSFSVKEIKNISQERSIALNEFFVEKIGKVIVSAKMLYDNWGNVYPYGVRISLENNENFTIRYISENEQTFDALIITE